LELVRRTRAADQRRPAEAATSKTRSFIGKPAEPFAKRAKNLLNLNVNK
jgi:hypothetical protein